MEAGRLRAGLAATDASRDDDVFMVMEITKDVVETYLDRGVVGMDQVDHFVDVHYPSLSLHRYPVHYITEIRSGAGSGSLAMSSIVCQHDIGLLKLDRTLFARELYISYFGGYNTWPAALEWAMWQTFDTLWLEIMGVAGGAGGGGGGIIVQGSGEVKSVSITGVGKIDYDVGASVAGGSSSSGSKLPDAAAFMIDPASRLAGILNAYQRKKA